MDHSTVPPTSQRAKESPADFYFTLARRLLLSVLPYPDLTRRLRVRRGAAALVTCKKWPGDDASGVEAAQLAMYRLLRLQRLTRRAVRARRKDEAALLARASLETCIVGLYCVFSGKAVAQLAGANYRAMRKVTSYITEAGLISAEALDSAIAALGETGPDLNIRELANTLAERHDLPIVRDLYAAYYVPLSHFFVHANAWTMLRHVSPDGALRRKPDFPWARRGPARLSDACTGLLAGNIAAQEGRSAKPFLAYAQAHVDRLVSPLLAFAFKGVVRSAGWGRIPGMALEVFMLRAYTHGPGLGDDAGKREQRIRAALDKLFGALEPDLPEGMFRQAEEEFVRDILAAMAQVAAGAQNDGDDGQQITSVES